MILFKIESNTAFVRIHYKQCLSGSLWTSSLMTRSRSAWATLWTPQIPRRRYVAKYAALKVLVIRLHVDKVFTSSRGER